MTVLRDEQIPVEKLPDDVQLELERLTGMHYQAEIYPSHGIVALRFRRKLSIRTEILVLPFSLLDATYLGRLQVLVGQATQGGAIVPANGPTPAPDTGPLQ